MTKQESKKRVRDVGLVDSIFGYFPGYGRCVVYIVCVGGGHTIKRENSTQEQCRLTAPCGKSGPIGPFKNGCPSELFSSVILYV